MKFTFSFQKLLDHKYTLEDMARRDWAEAKAALDRAEGELKKMYRQIDDSRKRAFSLGVEGGQRGTELAQIDAFISGQNIRIERQRIAMRPLLAEVERTHAILVAAAQERKTLEKLKERKLEEYRQKRKKLELKRMDEIVVTRFRHQED